MTFTTFYDRRIALLIHAFWAPGRNSRWILWGWLALIVWAIAQGLKLVVFVLCVAAVLIAQLAVWSYQGILYLIVTDKFHTWGSGHS
jgi:hypothetical protein